MTDKRRLNKLKKGDKIALISPSGRVEKKKILNAIQVLENWGLEVVIGQYTFNEFHKFAGTDQERLSDLQWALNHTEVKAILCTRGGYGLVRIIDQVDFSKFTKTPKWIVGFSDITVLHNVVNELGFPSLHAPMPNSYLNSPHDVLLSLKEALFKENYQYPNPLFKENEVAGGNLCILYSLLGTNHDISTHNKVLFLEEIGEYAYNVDRMLYALKKAGKLTNLKGLALGYFTDIKQDDFGISLKEIVLNITKEYDYPVVFDIKAGHEDENYPIVFGKQFN